MPVYSKKNKHILFIHIPKSGGSTLSKVLQNEDWDESFCIRNKPLRNIKYLNCSPQHFHNEIIKEIFNINKFEKIFTIVRNPFERLKSEYYWQLKQKIISNISPQDWLNNILEEYKENKFIYDNHIRPQNEFIFEKAKIFKLEEGMDKVFKFILGHNIITTNKEIKLKKSDYKILIENEFLKLKTKIKDFYAEDYKMLEY